MSEGKITINIHANVDQEKIDRVVKAIQTSSASLVKSESGIIRFIPERGRYILMNYAKAVAAVVATVLTAVVAAMAGGISPNEWVNVAIAGVGAAAVFAAPNVPGAKYTKSVLAVLAAVLTFLASLTLGGGLSQTDVLQILVVALGALGVYAVPNKGYALDAAEGP